MSLPDPGVRVRVVRWVVTPGGFDDNNTVPPGTEGTVQGDVSDSYSRKIDVEWDNGARLALLADRDEYEVIG